MGTKTKIAIVAAVILVVALVGGAYAYDSAEKDKIADGITIAGVDVSGMNASEAEAAVRAKLVAPLRDSLKVKYDGESWTLDGSKLKVRADIAGAVEEAVAKSQDGGIPNRLVRYVTGGQVDDKIPAEVEYSQSAINRFVRHVADEINREPKSATVDPNADGLELVSGKDGRKVRDVRLTDDLEAAVVNADAPRAIVASVHSTKPKITTKDVASEYPSYLTLDRGTFTLRLWKNLKLAKSYTVAVGMEGLETPEGLYEIQEKEENPTWHVPDSDWAGSLAGTTVPPGPSNPIKARWMGIYEGAGIHGTEETESLGTAGSHGCIRMAISDVEELYEQVEVGTPIFIG